MGFGVKSEVGKVFSNHTHVALSSSLTIFILFSVLILQGWDFGDKVDKKGFRCIILKGAHSSVGRATGS